MFALYGRADLGMLLKSYKAVTTNGKSTLVITCETTDPHVLAYSVRELDETAAAQKRAIAATKAAAKAARKPKPAAPMLALPAPRLALPKPE